MAWWPSGTPAVTTEKCGRRGAGRVVVRALAVSTACVIALVGRQAAAHASGDADVLNGTNSAVNPWVVLASFVALGLGGLFMAARARHQKR